MAWRTSWKGQEANQWPQWVWAGSQSLGSSAQLMAGQLGSGGYGTNIGWDGSGGASPGNPLPAATSPFRPPSSYIQSPGWERRE